MKNKYSDAGKGDKLRRNISPKEWDKRWKKIFNTTGSSKRQVYSTNACKMEKNGGPYEIDLLKINKTTRSK